MKTFIGSAFAIALSAGAVMAQTTAPTTPPSHEPLTFVSRQPPEQWMGSLFMGVRVVNSDGATVGDVGDLLFDKTGKITNVVLGVGGFLGLGEKLVAIPFSDLKLATGPDGQHYAEVRLTKDDLMNAPAFTQTEKTMFMKAKEKASSLAEEAKNKIDEVTRQNK